MKALYLNESIYEACVNNNINIVDLVDEDKLMSLFNWSNCAEVRTETLALLSMNPLDKSNLLAASLFPPSCIELEDECLERARVNLCSKINDISCVAADNETLVFYEKKSENKNILVTILVALSSIMTVDEVMQSQFFKLI